MSRRQERLRGQLGAFMRAYGRRAGRGGMDPNDRHYDRELEAAIKRMDPEELDRLMHGEPEADEQDESGL